MPNPNYLARTRKQWALSKRELAALAGTSRSVISRAELGKEAPSLRTVFALQVIFGASPKELFPILYRHVEEEVMRRAVKIDRAIDGDATPAAALKHQLLTKMMKHAAKSEEV